MIKRYYSFISLQNIASDLTTVITPAKSASQESANSQELSAVIPGVFFTLIQVFCHTCHMITLIPSDITDQLFVLSLDLLGRIEELLTGNTEQVNFEWTNQKAAMETVIDNLENKDQRQTLMQKIISL